MRIITLFLLLSLQTALFSQIKFAIELQEDEVTYLVKLKPDESYASPMNTTNTAQLSFVVPTGGFLVGNIQNIKGKWSNNNNLEAPTNNPNMDYIVFNLVGHLSDIDYTQDQEVPLFSFENIGIKTGMPRFVTKNDVKLLKSKNLNIGNHISVLGAGFKNAFAGVYAEEEEEGPEMEEEFVLYGTPLPGTFDLDLNVKKHAITLEWLAENKDKTTKYIIEKSMNGIDFEPFKIVKPNGEVNLSEADNAPDYGTNYYRVGQQLSTGEYRYSTIQSEKFLIDESSISMYPNPVKDHLNLSVGHCVE